jgi:hypothetical protein
MKSKWPLAATAILLLGGCSAAEEPTTNLGNQRVRVEKPHGKTDALGLPLEITIAAPPVPKAIEGPSPPIRESPKKPPNKKKAAIKLKSLPGSVNPGP